MRKLRPVDKYTLDGQFIRSFDTMAEAARDVGGTKSNIAAVCQGNKRMCKGFRYAYHGEPLPEWIPASTPVKNTDNISEKEAYCSKVSLLRSDYFGYFGNIGY